MTQKPDVSPVVGENVAATLDDQARRAALFQAAIEDFEFLARHGDRELLQVVRDLNMRPDAPESYRLAHSMQEMRRTVRHLLTTLGFEQAIIPEPRSEINEPRRRVRPPIVDVQLP
jgi:Cft2 family RNA processing exonuclease